MKYSWLILCFVLACPAFGQRSERVRQLENERKKALEEIPVKRKQEKQAKLEEEKAKEKAEIQERLEKAKAAREKAAAKYNK